MRRAWLAQDLIIQPDAIAVITRDNDGSGTVLKTSLSKEDEKELQVALHGSRDGRATVRMSPHRRRRLPPRSTQVRVSQQPGR